MTLRVGVLLEGNSAGATKSITSVREAMAGLTRSAGETSAALRKADVDAYGKQLDALRARYNPLFATIQRYKAEIASIRDAHRVGAISADEMAAAITRERQAALGSIAAIKQRNAAIAETPVAAQNTLGNRFNSANIAAQFQDIGVTTAMGMNPLQIALQQGTQLSAVFNEMRMAGQGLGATLFAAFTSIINPISLVTIGVIAAGAATLQWLGSLNREAPDADEALETHLEWIDKVAAGYGTIQQAAKDAAEQARRMPQAEVRMELTTRQQADLDAYRAAVAAVTEANLELRLSELALYETTDDSLSAANAQAADMLALQAAINQTNPDLDGLVLKLKEMERTAADEVIAETAREFLELVNAARQAAAAVDVTTASLRAANQVAANMSVGNAMEGVGAGLERIRALAPDLRTEYQKVNDELARVKAQATADLPTALAQPIILAAEDEAARTIAALKAQEAEREAARMARQTSDYDRSIEQIRERTRSLQTESNVVGLSTFAAERYRITLELENAARKDAAGLTAERIEQIRAEANAYAAAAAQQEAIAERQKQIDEELGFYRQTFTGFFSDLYGGLRQGADGWAAFAEAGANALDSIAQRALDMAANGIFDLILGALGGAVSGGVSGGWSIPTSYVSGGFFPGLATGGDVLRGGWTMVGERGPELLNLPGGARVMNSSDSRAMAAAGGGTVVQLIDQRSSGRVEQQRTKGLNGEEIVRAIVRDELPAAYGDAIRRSMIG